MSRASPSSPPSRPEILLADDRVIALRSALGRGHAATVYDAVLEAPFRVRRRVACKVFDVIPTDSRDHVVTAIARAVRGAALVSHPNVVSMLEFTVLDDAQPVIVSELVDGWSLATLLAAYARRGRRLPLDLGLFLATEIAEGLAAARGARTVEGVRREVVHHDLSSREVLLTRAGDVKISDFGIARAVRAGSSVRYLRALTGRAVSMAPEVVASGLSDARSDVFSLGLLLREMLVGPRFRPDVTDTEVLDHARAGYVEIGVFEPQLPEPLASILRRTLEVDPKARYPHAGALAYELRRASLSLGVGDGRFFLRNVLEEEFVRRRFVVEDDETTVKHGPFTPFIVERTDETFDDGLSEDETLHDDVPIAAPFGDPDDLAVTNEVRVSGIVPTLADEDEDDDLFRVPDSKETTGDS